jgi:hypothetical protein
MLFKEIIIAYCEKQKKHKLHHLGENSMFLMSQQAMFRWRSGSQVQPGTGE